MKLGATDRMVNPPTVPGMKGSTMSRQPMWRLSRWAGLGFATATLAACAPTIVNNGFMIDEDAVQQIQPGQQTREQVAQILGTPSSVAAFDDQTWLYIHRRTSQYAFLDPQILDQNVIAITFDRNSGTVSGVRRLTLADGQAIEPVERITPSPGKELTVLDQFLGNIGRFNNANQNRAQR